MTLPDRLYTIAPTAYQGTDAMPSSEIIFEVTEAAEGGYNARALGYGIFTQGDDWGDLKAMVKDAVLCHFDDGEAPAMIRLHLVRSSAFRGSLAI